MERAEISRITYYLQRNLGERENYSQELIQLLKSEETNIELAICISACNEPYQQFLLSLKSIIKSTALLCQNRADIDPSNIVIFLIQDGKEKVTDQFLTSAHGRIVTRQLFSQIQEFYNRESYDSGADTLHFKQRNNLLRTIHETASEYVELSATRPRESRNILPSYDSRNDEHVIPMTEYAIAKWSDTQTLNCFCSLTSIHQFSSQDDQEQIIETCLGDVPQMRLIYAVKQKNLGKLDSHRFFFDGFCRDLNPRYCMLLDCGTEFDNNTMFGLFRLGDVRPSMGGASIEIESEWKWIPIVMAQFFEYKIVQVFKSAEAVYGLLQILPGALQFLKWEAVRGNALNIYCEGTEQDNYSPNTDKLGLFKRNVFLTEDKLMATLIQLRDDKIQTVDYLPGTTSYTDVPRTTTAILRQRRRWLNGGFSCTLYGFSIFFQEYKKSMMHKTKPCLGFMLFLQLLFYFLLIFIQASIAFDIINFWYLVLPVENLMKGEKYTEDFSLTDNISYLFLAFNLFSIPVFLLSLFANSQNKFVSFVFEVLHILFMGFNALRLYGMFFIFHLALNNEIANAYWIPQIPMAIMSIMSLIMVTITFILIKPKEVFTSPVKFFLGFLLYFLESNTFFYFVKIYLISNYHDVSWGSRGANKVKSSSIGKSYRCTNFWILMIWFFVNGAMVYLFIFFPYKQYLFYFIIFIMMIQTGVRCVECMVFQWKWFSRRNHKIFGAYKERERQMVPMNEYREYLLKAQRKELSVVWHSSDETQSRSGKVSDSLERSFNSQSLTTTAKGKLSKRDFAWQSEGMTSEDEKESVDRNGIRSLRKLPSTRNNETPLKFGNRKSNLWESETEEEKARSLIFTKKLTHQHTQSDNGNFNGTSNYGESEESLLIQEQLFGRNDTSSTKAQDLWNQFDLEEAMKRPTISTQASGRLDSSELDRINSEKLKG